MKIKRESELMADIKGEYDKDKHNWRILRGKDSRQHINTYIAQDDKKLWQIKTELKNPLQPIGFGSLVKRNLNDEIGEIMNKGTDLPIHEVYPNNKNLIIAFGLGKYSQKSTNDLGKVLRDTTGYNKKVEQNINTEFEKLLKKEQLFDHYI